MKSTKNSVTIRLTESAVFLRTDAPNGRPSRHGDTRSSTLRGLLTLDLVKPTKITSIDVELSATTSTAWPEGIGARRIEVTEDHRIFHASTLYFRASKSTSNRRTASIGPGVVLHHDEHDHHHSHREYHHRNDDDDDRPSCHQNYNFDYDEEGGELEYIYDNDPLTRTPRGEHSVVPAGVEHPTLPSFTVTSSPQPPVSFISSQTSNHTSILSSSNSFNYNIPCSLPPMRTPWSALNRRVSMDSSNFHPIPLAHHEGLYTDLPIPPYSPIDPNTPLSSPTDLEGGQAGINGAMQALEELDSPLQSSLRDWQRSESSSSSSIFVPLGHSTSSASNIAMLSSSSSSSISLSTSHLSPSTHPNARRSHSLSRAYDGMDDVPEHDDYDNAGGPSTPRASRSISRNRETTRRQRSLTPAGSFRPSSLSGSAENSGEGSMNAIRSSPQPLLPFITTAIDHTSMNGAVTTILNAGKDPVRDQGRKHSSFSLLAVSHALKDAVRSGSSRSPMLPSEVDRGKDREGSRDEERRGRMGRTVGGGTEGDSACGGGGGELVASDQKERRHRDIGRIFGVGTDEVKEKDPKNGNGWKEFKKGTYTYPISFSIPGNAPPTLQCDFGSVVWRLRASVHRPGTFIPKMTATRDVMMIACPTEEDTEDTENIIVERHWDQQLQYLISISGRSFYIGGTVPITFVLLPLMKVKIYRLSVFIEERVDYYTHMRRIARSDPITRIELLSVKAEGKDSRPILPLDSDDVDAFRKSPLHALINPEEDESDVASSLMGPGPWTFHQELKLPWSCDMMKFTNRNRRANITITHTLKCVMRVERGDDLHVDGKTGKRKLFDIVVQTPVHILSCRCNPEWISLPRYSEMLDDKTIIIPNCPCQVKRMMMRSNTPDFNLGFRAHLPAALERMTSRQSLDDSASGLNLASGSRSGSGSGPVSGSRSKSGSVVGTAETSPINPSIMRSLRQSNEPLVRTSEQFERLVSGRESVFGEVPPAYSVDQRGGGSGRVTVR